MWLVLMKRRLFATDGANAENGPPFFLVGEVRAGVFCFKFYLVWKADLDSGQ